MVAKTGSEGETYAKSIADQYGFTVKSLDQSATMYESVKSGSAVAVFDDYPVLAYGIAQNNGLKTVTDKVPGGSYGFAVNKGQEHRAAGGIQRRVGQAEGRRQLRQDPGQVPCHPRRSGPHRFRGPVGQVLPGVDEGPGKHLLVTGISFVVAMASGVVAGFMKISRNIVLRGIATTFVNIFRGTPILVWAFFFYFGLAQLIGQPVNIWVAGVLTLSLNPVAHTLPRSCAGPSKQLIPASSKRAVHWDWDTESPCRRWWSRRRSRS